MMSKTPLSVNKGLMNIQNKNKPDSLTMKPSSDSNKRKRNSGGVRNQQVQPATTTDKENVGNNTQSLSDISDDESINIQASPPKVARRISPVFEYATKISSQEYQCKLCLKIIRCGKDTNSNIRRHLALQHGKLELASKSHRFPRIHIPSDKKQKLDEAAIHCIILDGRPWGDFRRSGMSKFLSVAIPGYSGPSSRTIQRNLSKLYFKAQHDFKAELSEVENVSLTVDLWRSARCQHFLCMTIHWLDSNFRIKGHILSFRKFKGRHLANRIRIHMQQVLVRYNLLNKIVATTTDNGSNVKAATSLIRLFGTRLHCLAHALNLTIQKGLNLWNNKTTSAAKNAKGSEQMDDSIESADDDASDDDMATADRNDDQMESDADAEDDDEQFDQDDDSSTSSSEEDDEQLHKNNDLSTSTSTSEGNKDSTIKPSSLQIKDITTLMEKCRTIVKTIRKSSILHEFVHTYASESSIKGGLIIDMQIRWSSSYKMLHRILVYQTVFEKLYEELDSLSGITKKQRDKILKSKLSGNDWNLIQTLRRVLERFDEATKVLSGQKYPTLSLAYAIVSSLLHYLNNRSSDTWENDIKCMLINSYKKYMIRDEKEMALIRVAAFLDPLTHDLLTLEDKEAAESFIIKEINEKYPSKNTLKPANNSLTTASNIINTNTNVSSMPIMLSCTSKGGTVIKNFLNKCGVGSNGSQLLPKKVLTIQQELAKLCSIPKDDLQFDTFWQENGENLSKLSFIARKYLSTTASSVPSESAFSVSNYILRKNRLALTSKNIKYGMFLKDKI